MRCSRLSRNHSPWWNFALYTHDPSQQLARWRRSPAEVPLESSLQRAHQPIVTCSRHAVDEERRCSRGLSFRRMTETALRGQTLISRDTLRWTATEILLSRAVAHPVCRRRRDHVLRGSHRSRRELGRETRPILTNGFVFFLKGNIRSV
jgi:hypothetical protein